MVVDVSDFVGCVEILGVYVKNKCFEDEVDFEMIVKCILGFFGVDLFNFFNEVVIFCGRRGKIVISFFEVDDFVDRIVVGMEGMCLNDGKVKSFVVYYEVGYVICGMFILGYDLV